MPRPHVEFIQSQRIAWRPHTEGLLAGTDSRELSADPLTGACTRVVRYPPGYQGVAVRGLLADEELFVLDGALLIDGRRFAHHAYAFLPAGHPRGVVRSDGGAVVLSFYSERPAILDALWRGDSPAARLIEHIDCYAVPWEPVRYKEMRSGALRKPLRKDPVTGDETWLLTSPPHGMPPGGAGARETHPTVEEVYVLDGDLHGNCGVMRPGAYFWRPPGILHGPYGTRRGATSLYRTVGGPLVAEWTADKAPFSYDPPYTPVLPPGLELLPEPASADESPF
jgi:hypothetical protein